MDQNDERINYQVRELGQVDLEIDTEYYIGPFTVAEPSEDYNPIIKLKESPKSAEFLQILFLRIWHW